MTLKRKLIGEVYMGSKDPYRWQNKVLKQGCLRTGKRYKRFIGRGFVLLLGAFLAFFAAKGLARVIPENFQSKSRQGIERIVQNEDINLNLDGESYTFTYLDSEGLIDSIVVEWNDTKKAEYKGRNTKYDIGNLYFLNFDNKVFYKKIPVVGGIYDDEDKPSSPHNDKMIAGGYVENPFYARKNIAGGAPSNPFGVGLVKLYNVEDKYSIEEILGFIDSGIKFPEKHDSRQLHGKALEASNLGYTLGCVKINNEDIQFLRDNKKLLVPIYFNTLNRCKRNSLGF